MNKVNYQTEMDQIIVNMTQEERVPTLLLHSCCAPCSSYVLEYLSQYFHITVFFYNPNISASYEYAKRLGEQKRLIASFNEKGDKYPIVIIEGKYEPALFLEQSKGLENCPEGGERCFGCYRLRLEKTAKLAASNRNQYDYFTTTLTISPLKDAGKINEIGLILSKEYNMPWLPSDFKKKNGYKRSIELSLEYDLYRQNYCGCSFSKRD